MKLIVVNYMDYVVGTILGLLTMSSLLYLIINKMRIEIRKNIELQKAKPKKKNLGGSALGDRRSIKQNLDWYDE